MPQSGASPARSGRIQIWNSEVSSSSRLYSAWVTPVPALITCTSPAPVRPVLPSESLCVIAPVRTKVMISMSRCGCGGKPLFGGDQVVVPHADRAPAHALGIVVVGEAEMEAGVEPAVVAVRQALEGTDVDHFG